MTHDDKKNLDRATSALRSDEPAADDIRSAGARLWHAMSAAPQPAVEQIHGCADVRAILPAYVAGQLSPARALIVRDHLGDCVACRNLAQAKVQPAAEWTAPVPRAAWSMRQFAFAAAVIAVIALSIFGGSRWYFATPAGARARVQSVDGALYRVAINGETKLKAGDEINEGEFVRTAAGAHAYMQLRDGSLVEMNERAEMSVSARRKDTTVNLDQGRIIVQAAKRRAGHLYVITPDARVAVTGTVFTVNSGMKGARVSVIEGEVHVTFGGNEDVLHSGEQAATSDSMSPVPVEKEIAWSRDLDKHLALLAQFAVLQKKFEQIPTPGLRYSSTVLNRLPANVTFYASIPNLGEALNEANRIFQDQLQQSPVLREWWNRGQAKQEGITFDEMVRKVHALSQYLGDEVVLVCLSGQPSGEADAVVVAQVRDSGVRQLLENQFATIGSSDGTGPQLRVLDERQLATAATTQREVMALVRPDFVLFSPSARALQLLNAELTASSSGFASTDFGRRVADSYAHGAGILIAANLQQMMAEGRQRHPSPKAPADAGLQRSGFGDARFLIAEHRDLSGTPDNRAEIDFAGARHGIASWLAAPAPIGSLDFVSADATIAAGFVTKSPALMLDDIVQMVSANSPNKQHDLAELDAKLNLNLREDLAAAFGGDAALALDGPILPKPSWKFIAQVNDPARVQSALEKLLDAANREAAEHGHPGAQMQSEVVNGRTFYAVRSPNPAAPEVHYTFADGYLVVAPSRALVTKALQTKANGSSLSRSPGFRSLLPKDANADFSAVLYQNLAPVIQPIAAQLSPQQLQSLQQMASDSKPTVVCAYGHDTRIEIASGSRLLPFDINTLGISALLGAREAGTSRAPHP